MSTTIAEGTSLPDYGGIVRNHDKYHIQGYIGYAGMIRYIEGLDGDLELKNRYKEALGKINLNIGELFEKGGILTSKGEITQGVLHTCSIV